MKIAIVYNRDSQAVINLFGQLNKEKYGIKTIYAIRDALKLKGHVVKTFEGDKNIIKNLEEFMPAVISGERPGFVFNLSYGIQGRSRYTHIPAILEMLGIPYIGSAPSTHAMALDKVVTKMILLQNGLPTPKFAVLEKPNDPIIEQLNYPLIIKPKDEASSFGLKIVNNEKELREGASYIYDTFKGDTLIEEYIDGREFNVGLLGNLEVRALPVVELTFDEGDKIYTHEDKSQGLSGRVQRVCPAPLDEHTTKKLSDLAIKTFKVIGCNDCARVDFRMDKDGNPYILEVNSMASLSQTASYVFAAKHIGIDYPSLINELIETASERYFGKIKQDEKKSIDSNLLDDKIFQYLTRNRDSIEDELMTWTNSSRDMNHPTGIHIVRKRLHEKLTKLGFRSHESFISSSDYSFWETKDGFEGGTLLVVPLDVPTDSKLHKTFRKDPEWLFGEGVASSSAGITCMLKSLDAIKSIKGTSYDKIGIFAYYDESNGMRHSGKSLQKISKLAKKVLVLQPGGIDNKIIVGRRGMRKYRLLVERDSLRPGSKYNSKDCYEWFQEKYSCILEKSKLKKRLDITVNDLKVYGNHQMRPNRLMATIYLSFQTEKEAELIEENLYKIFTSSSRSIKVSLGKLENRPPLNKRKIQVDLINEIKSTYEKFGFDFGTEMSLLPSASGDIADSTPCVCGMSPFAKSIYTDEECINRAELLKKTIILASLLNVKNT